MSKEGSEVIQVDVNIDTSTIEEKLDTLLSRLGEFPSPSSEDGEGESQEGEETEAMQYSSLLELVSDVRQDQLQDRFLTKSFEDYTTVEGLLLTIILFLFLSALVRILKRGFAWLL